MNSCRRVETGTHPSSLFICQHHFSLSPVHPVQNTLFLYLETQWRNRYRKRELVSVAWKEASIKSSPFAISFFSLDTILVWDALIVFLERKEKFTHIRVGRISPVVDIYNGVRIERPRHTPGPLRFFVSLIKKPVVAAAPIKNSIIGIAGRIDRQALACIGEDDDTLERHCVVLVIESIVVGCSAW